MATMLPKDTTLIKQYGTHPLDPIRWKVKRLPVIVVVRAADLHHERFISLHLTEVPKAHQKDWLTVGFLAGRQPSRLVTPFSIESEIAQVTGVQHVVPRDWSVQNFAQGLVRGRAIVYEQFAGERVALSGRVLNPLPHWIFRNPHAYLVGREVGQGTWGDSARLCRWLIERGWANKYVMAHEILPLYAQQLMRHKESGMSLRTFLQGWNW